MQLSKDVRWRSKKYTDWVATLPCTNCGADDGTVVAHHLLTMALCYVCHDKAHNGDHDILDNQFLLIWKTQNQAFKEGRLQYVSD
jgi:hypothetical protein